MSDAPDLRDNAYMCDDDELINEFQPKEFPFCVMVDQAGHIAWSGSPDHRDLHLDFTELLAERCLVDTEDWLDDPDEPLLDPDEIDPKSLPQKKPKSIKDMLKEQHEKFTFYTKLLSAKNKRGYEPTDEELAVMKDKTASPEMKKEDTVTTSFYDDLKA